MLVKSKLIIHSTIINYGLTITRLINITDLFKDDWLINGYDYHDYF